MISSLSQLQEREHSQRMAFEATARSSLMTKQSSGIGAIPNPQELFASRESFHSLTTSPSIQKAVQGYSLFRSWTYVAVNAIAKRVAGQTWEAGEIVGAAVNPDRSHGSRSRRKAYQVGRKLYGGGELNVLDSHDVLDVLENPNPLQHSFEFLYMTAANLLLSGTAYWVGGLVDGEGGQQLELWAMPTSWVHPKHDKGLFAEYELKPPEATSGVTIPAENVARTYLPDPANIKTAMAPLQAVMAAVKTDDYIQSTQQKMFERGMSPTWVVSVGRVRGPDGRMMDKRPVLTGAARRQIIRSIREVWDQTVNLGDPAIIDGMIENIQKLQTSPSEMDFPNSGEIVKKRVLQAYGVNPYIVGEVTGVNKAQAVVAEQQFCSSVVNPIINALTTTATEWLGPIYETPKRLVVWLEECLPIDPDQKLREWQAGQMAGAVTVDEFRSEILGLGPLEKTDSRAAILETVGGMQGAVMTLQAVGMGFVQRDAAAKLFELFFQIDEERAREIVGEEEPEEEDEPEPVPEPEPEPEDEEDEEDELDLSSDMEDEEESDIEDQAAFELLALKHIKQLEAASPRDEIKSAHQKQQTAVEEVVSKSLAKHFRDTIKDASSKIAKLDINYPPEQAEQRAAEIVKQVFDLKAARKDLAKRAGPALLRAFIEGAYAELLMQDKYVRPKLSQSEKVFSKTTAGRIIERLGLEWPGDQSIAGGVFSFATELPQWLAEAAFAAMRETFRQDYWLRIDEVTRGDVQAIIEEGIQDGWSARRIAAAVQERRGPEYSRYRAMNTARTETGNAMNAGHSAGIEQLRNDTGLDVRKEWLSVLGPTTRMTHAEMDGAVSDKSGMFDFHGQQIPWPGHYSLEAAERVNCQCTETSTILEPGEDEPSHGARPLTDEELIEAAQ